MALIEVKVPDIGDFKDVAVIEILVKPGDAVAAEQSLVTVESDKASMEIPSSAAGVVKELKVALGDKINEGSLLLLLEGAAEQAAAAPAPAAAVAAAAAAVPAAAGAALPAPPAASYAGGADLECDLLVLGAGPGGYSAAFRAADLGLKTVIVERYATLGGVCLNVGCIPSKALLHVAAVIDEVRHFADLGVEFGAPRVDLPKLLGHKNKVVGKLTGGLAAMAKMRKVTVLRGYGSFADPYHVVVEQTSGDGQAKTGQSQTVRFKQCIIAAGSGRGAAALPAGGPAHRRFHRRTGAGADPEAHADRRRRHHRPGDGHGVFDTRRAPGRRRDARRPDDRCRPRPGQGLAEAECAALRPDHAEDQDRGCRGQRRRHSREVRGSDGKHSDGLYDLVLQAVGRSPNGGKIAADKAGVAVSERGFIPVDVQMRTNVAHIFAIGDVVGQPMLAHKAVHEAHVAAEVAAGDSKARFDARVIRAWPTPTRDRLGRPDRRRRQGARHRREEGPVPVDRVGPGDRQRPRRGLHQAALRRPSEGGHRILGGGIVGTHAGDMIGEIALAIEMGADEIDIGKTIHPHPTLGESIGMAAEVAHGSCTDLPPVRR